jgi:hypothetical protein
LRGRWCRSPRSTPRSAGTGTAARAEGNGTAPGLQFHCDT